MGGVGAGGGAKLEASAATGGRSPMEKPHEVISFEAAKEVWAALTHHLAFTPPTAKGKTKHILTKSACRAYAVLGATQAS